MNHTQNHERSRATLERLPLLIDLFYGFAIANGLSDAIKSTVEKHSSFQWFFLLMAFLLGIGDWLSYHIHISHIPYHSLRRLLMDMLFPALVYCLLLAPTLTPTAAGLSYISWIVFVYFAFAVIYGILLQREDPHSDPLLLRVLVVAFTMSLGALLFSYLLSTDILKTIFVDLLATAAVGFWAAYNLWLVYQTMHSDVETTSGPKD